MLERIGLESFSEARLQRAGTWAVAFLADWCPFCQEFRSRFESLELKDGGRLIADVTDPNDPLWDGFRIEVVPTVIVFRDGAAGPRFDGVPGEGLDGVALTAIATAIDGRSRTTSPAPGRSTRRGTEG